MSLLRQCLQLESLDVTGCFHVSNTSLVAAIDVIVTSSLDHPALTLCLGGLSFSLLVCLLLSFQLTLVDMFS